MAETFQRIGVVGAGAWGTALAQTLVSAGRDVLLWAFERDLVAEINASHENARFLRGVPLSNAIRATSDLAAMGACDALLLVVPAQFLRATATQLAPHIRPGMPLVICAKGIEQATGKLLTQVLAESVPQATPAALSGPSFAIEVAAGLPAAVTLAAADHRLAGSLARAIAHRNLRLYLSDDLTGVEVGGAVKNVLAIAAGVVEGKRLGRSAHAAIITRGFAELTRYALAMGARRETMEGLSGLGDLVLTCSSSTSRNMSLGHALGEGKPLAEILAARTAVTEGMYTAIPVTRVARELGIEMPICEAVRNLLWGGRPGHDFPPLTVDEAIENLMSRPMKPEDE
jgi:glycerol-3-phosphate dehydrogenase (NAD(P)+)